jgi:hypothetical protein
MNGVINIRLPFAYCGKKTAFLEDLNYCSVCVDCLGEIEEQDDSPFDLNQNDRNHD